MILQKKITLFLSVIFLLIFSILVHFKLLGEFEYRLFTGISLLLFSIWLFFDNKQFSILYSSMEIYIYFFTIIGPITFFLYIRKTRKSHWLKFYVKAVGFILLLFSRFCFFYIHTTISALREESVFSV